MNDTVSKTGLYPPISSVAPEVRLRYVHLLQTTTHIGKEVSLLSSENVCHNQFLQQLYPSSEEKILPNILQPIAKQIVQTKSRDTLAVTDADQVLIPLPIFTQNIIESLPTMTVRVPLAPEEFNWNEFLQYLADDLEVERTDLILVDVQEGSTIFKIKLRPALTQRLEKWRKIKDKLSVMAIPKAKKFCENSAKYPSASKVHEIQCEFENFVGENTKDDDTPLSPEDLDVVLRLSERPAVIDRTSWRFLKEKSRMISTILSHSFQECTWEYVLDHAALVFNENIFDKYYSLTSNNQNEKVLFHGTSMTNFNGIFQENFRLKPCIKKTDNGWFGKGFYFSNSPRKASYYAKSKSKQISYLICCLVQLSESLIVTDMRYQGKDMHPNYDSHYIPTTIAGEPISNGNKPTFEEYVIKRSEQIMPLYIVGLRRANSFCSVARCKNYQRKQLGNIRND